MRAYQFVAVNLFSPITAVLLIPLWAGFNPAIKLTAVCRRDLTELYFIGFHNHGYHVRFIYLGRLSCNDGIIESVLAGAFVCSLIYWFIIWPMYFATLCHVPGPIWCKLSWYHLAYFDAQLRRNDKIVEWHRKHGLIICIRPESVSIADPV